MMPPATTWRWCAAAGIVAFLFSWGFGRIPGLVACGPSGGLGPILAFEFVASPGDVATLFGVEPCRSRLVGAQKTGLLLDNLGFIPAYTTFLILAAMAGARTASRPPPFAVVVAATLAFAGLCDEIEGGLLYLILIDLPGDQASIDALWWPVHIKFALLGIGTAAVGWQLITRKRAAAIVSGAVVVSGATWALRGLLVDLPAMMGGFTIAWVTILLCALVGSWKPSLFSDSAGPLPTRASPSA